MKLRSSTFLIEVNIYLESFFSKNRLNIKWGDLRIINKQATKMVLYKKFVDLMSSKAFKLIITKATLKKMGF